MNLSDSFPNIDDFFNKYSFSQDDLTKFIVEIKKNYDRDTYKSAISYINLKLLQYELGYQPHEIKSNQKEPDVDQVKEKIVVPKTIKDLAIFLQESDSLLLTLLEQRGIKRKIDDTLNESEYQTIENFVLSRLKAIKRKEKQEINIQIPNIKKSHNRYNSKSIPVYEKLAIYGMSKLIYIRKS